MSIGIDKAQGLLKTAGATIRTLGEENDALKAKVAQYEKRERAEKIARDMDEKGLEADRSFEEKVAGLLDSDLDVAEQAVKMASSGSNLFGTPSEDTPSGADAKTAFETFIATGE